MLTSHNCLCYYSNQNSNRFSQHLKFAKYLQFFKKMVFYSKSFFSNKSWYNQLLRERLLQTQQDQMKNQQFHICFSFNKLILTEKILSTLQIFASFKVQLFKVKQLIGFTEEILLTPDEECQIKINNQEIQFKTRRTSERQPWELRLIEVSQNGQLKLVGCYEFILDNYLKAYQKLNASCSELFVEIGLHFQIGYEVYVQKTPEALKRIIFEHQSSKKLSFIQQASEELTTFLPEQLRNQHLFVQSREIRYDLHSPLIFQPRFWSPKRKRLRKAQSKGSNCTKEAMNNSKSTLQLQDNRVTFMKVKKTDSFMSQVEQSKHHKVRRNSIIMSNKIGQQMEQVAHNQEQFHHKRYRQLFQVISSDSKILLPYQDNDSYDFYRSNTDRPKASAKDQVQLQSSSKMKRSTKSMPNCKNNFKQYTFIFMLVFLFVMAASFLLFQNNKTTHKIKVNKRLKQKISRRKEIDIRQ